MTIAGFIISSFIWLLPTVNATGSFITETYNGRNYKLYIPSGYQAGSAVPLVVMLHGCTQDPDQFAAGTQMNNLAETENFIVMYPEQTSSANSNKCWNWFAPAHQSRGSGEPALIAGMVNQVKSTYSIDSNRVFVSGLSAGAAMSVIMGATYPDIFAAIGVGAGLEYKAATSLTNAYTAMNSGGPNPVQQGNAAYTAMGSAKRAVPVIVFHGTSDYTVYSVNAHQVISQWAQTNNCALDSEDNNNIADVADETITGSIPGGRSYTRYVYKDSSGAAIMEKYMIDRMGHAWSGGSSSGSYTDPRGPNATQIIWNFFKHHPMNESRGATLPVTIAAPDGGTYASAVNVTLSVNESAATYYTTDGSIPTIHSTRYTAPILISTTATLKFFSIDSAGNQESIKTEAYNINASGCGSSIA
ncbi:extracellular catalytic domain type 1 short-chain-length polyhydroxyalkanoate depolymerase [Ectobacillus panaciterrae]|uniref:extracellular catalytic domain type 1 short-chain-length polyhydroxyalkanoate depolymerase n=1 Tax=Ectobacillus panaciterrae TaxID=363872 RepID=UPI0003F5A195|nr:PHB depolymerase family esterase [Ectobacillus panaciterrae]